MIEKFYTENKIAVPAVSIAQMLEVDIIAMNETGPNIYQMMENAGRNLAELIIKMSISNSAKTNILVLAGTGGNGGGGICAARHLINHGLKVMVCLTNSKGLKEVTRNQLELYKLSAGKLISIDNVFANNFNVIIDSIIGYNLKRQLKGNELNLINWSNVQNSIKIVLDVPTGVNATTGEILGTYFHTSTTLTLALPKTGLLPKISGELFLGDIGIPTSIYKRIGIKVPQNIFNKSYSIKLYSNLNLLE